jgi:hypothetical protein
MKFNILLSLLLGYLFIENIHSQSKVNGFSICTKLGFYQPDGGFASGFEFNVQSNYMLFSLNAYSAREFQILGDEPDEKFNQVNIMLGQSRAKKLCRFQYEIGLGTFWGTKRGDFISSGYLTSTYEKDDFTTIGIPAKIGFKFVPFTFFSIGIDFHANLNSEKPLVMPMISIEFGKIREKLNLQ